MPRSPGSSHSSPAASFALASAASLPANASPFRADRTRPAGALRHSTARGRAVPRRRFRDDAIFVAGFGTGTLSGTRNATFHAPVLQQRARRAAGSSPAAGLRRGARARSCRSAGLRRRAPRQVAHRHRSRTGTCRCGGRRGARTLHADLPARPEGERVGAQCGSRRRTHHAPISPTMPRRKASTQTTKIVPVITVTHCPKPAK